MPLRNIPGVILAAIILLPVASGLSALKEAALDFGFGAQAGTAVTGDGLVLSANASLDGSWSGPFGPKSPDPRVWHTMVYDSIHGVHLLYAGANEFDDTWAYDAVQNKWTRLFAHSPPGMRKGHTMAFDSKNGVAVVFGGQNNGDYLSDTWLYNYSDNSWKLARPSPFPPAREYAAMGFDPVNGVVVLFGGYNNPENDRYFNDTWTYNVGTNSWRLMNPALSPVERADAGLVYEPVSGEFLLYGGRRSWIEHDEGGNYFAGEKREDLWSYNVSTNAWKEILSRGPGSAQSQSMVYDASSRLVYLHGVSDTEMPFYDPAKKQWDGKAVSSGPLGSFGSTLTYDDRTREMVLFGGDDREHRDLPADTWTYNSSANEWTARDKAAFTRTRSHFGMAFDDQNGVAVVFGSSDALYTYNPSSDRWTREKSVEHPCTRRDPAIAYDSDRGVVVLYGGVYGPGDIFKDTWTYNVSTDNWTEMNATPSPPDGQGYSMVYDSDRGKMLLFGGRKGWDYYKRTWEYDRETDKWTDLSPATSPSARDGAGMVYDSANHVAVLFGGSGPAGTLGDTWTYDPAANKWVQCYPSASPPARTEFGFAYDPSLGESVLFGGLNGYPPLDDTWTYNVTAVKWTGLRLPVSPPRRFGHNMVYDTVSSRFILYGGTDLTVDYAEVWLLDLEGRSTSGSYTSPAFSTGGRAFYGGLEWDATVPPETSVKFQLRSCATESGLDASAFVGPDGTPCSYYTVSGHRISGIHDGSRWVRYRALLSSENRYASPSIKSVTVNFNLVHSLSVQSPSAGEIWSGFKRVLWSASDPDNDTIAMDLVLLGAGGNTVLAAGIIASDGNWLWNTSTAPNGTYRLQLFARDGNPSIPLEVSEVTGQFTVSNAPAPSTPATPDHPPRLTGPPPPSACVGRELRYQVTATDEDGDTLLFSLTAGPAGMSIDPSSGLVRWTPARDQLGSHSLVIRVSDGRGLAAELTSTVRAVLMAPSCTVIAPAPGAVVKDRVRVTGTARPGSLALKWVEVRLDGGSWTNASGTENWSLDIALRKLARGPHWIEARSSDGEIMSDTVSVQISVKASEPSTSSGSAPGATVALLLLATLAGAALFGRRRMRR